MTEGADAVSAGTRWLGRLREAVLRPAAGDPSDGQLLERYLNGEEISRDEAREMQ